MGRHPSDKVIQKILTGQQQPRKTDEGDMNPLKPAEPSYLE